MATNKIKDQQDQEQRSQPTVKLFGTMVSKNIDVEERTVEFVITDESRDRDGDVIKISSWNFDNYLKNPIVCYMHDTGQRYNSTPDPDVVIGHCVELKIEDGQVIAVAKFDRKEEEDNPLAEKVFKKIVRKTLRATSVGFIPIDGHWGNIENGEDSGTFYFTDCELTEFSVVALPSNPNAIVRNYEGQVDSFKTMKSSETDEKNPPEEEQKEDQDEEVKDINHVPLYGHRLRLLSINSK